MKDPRTDPNAGSFYASEAEYDAAIERYENQQNCSCDEPVDETPERIGVCDNCGTTYFSGGNCTMWLGDEDGVCPGLIEYGEVEL